VTTPSSATLALGTDSLFISPQADELLRGELHGLEHLEAHARQLASACTVAPPTGPIRPLLHRFHENGRILNTAYREITAAYARQETLGQDAEWLVDNFYIVEDVLREVRHDLPRGYYNELPRLRNGPLAGYPRVYALALALVAHTDSGPDEAHITRFVQAFQTVTPLTIGELWAVPTMLRLSLVENLRRLAQQMLRAWDERRQAHLWVTRHAGVAEQASGQRAFAPLPCETEPFLVHLMEALRNHESLVSAGIDWLEAYLAQRSSSTAEVVRREGQRQAANQVTIGNCVTSLRLLAAFDWNVFFERVSLVEALLRDDPSGTYSRQDFATRDRYRQAVEQLARGADRGEMDVGRQALDLARRGAAAPGLPRNHVGYYLAGRGRAEIEQRLGYRPTLRERLPRFVLGHANAIYFGTIGLLTLAMVSALASIGWQVSAGAWLLTVLVLLLPASELAVGLVNYLVTLTLRPRVLPKLDFKEGIPLDCATFVVMPSMLVRPESAASLLEKLEIHYLANPDAQLRFALITDFADAQEEQRPEDESYVQAAVAGVQALNNRYAPEGPDRFFLFHRKRLWNPVQGCWMGWERKRGKLLEFNRLLRGATDTSFTTTAGDMERLPHIRFVITLDVDTRLPRETAQKLVGTLAHPLNQARFDPARGRVVDGYAILQPRVTFHMTAAARSLFSRIYTGSAGIDPYTTAVSDVYQDLFGAGSYTGKGIYDLDAFETALGDRFPENHILSHDLIEGNFARCGLVTDIELLDDFPPRYHAYARREHRWARGDWQLLPWLFGRDGLPLLERWKIVDNLRRSLVPPALVILLALGWTVLPGSPWTWTGVALAVLSLPFLLQCFGSLLSVSRGASLLGVFRELTGSAPATLGQVLLSIVWLPDQARSLVDAAVRTVARLFVTKQNLLEWETAFSTERRLGTGLVSFFLTMWPGLAVTAAIALSVWSAGRPDGFAAASPFLALWLLSPLVAYVVSRPRATAEAPLRADEQRRLRRVARKTWGFFEAFVGSDDHWLPPDNYQEDPKGDIAHRTSPTNMGLLTLSSLAAHDLGYLGLRTLALRLEKTFDTFGLMDRHRGHFLNWYDTRTLQPLQPAYVSTVDSGNLLGCFVALRQGLREKAEELLPPSTLPEGLADTLELAAEALRKLTSHPGVGAVEVFDQLQTDVRVIGNLLAESPGDLLQWRDWLLRLDHRAGEMRERVRILTSEMREIPEELERWTRRFFEQARDQRTELAEFLPWLDLLAKEAERPGGASPQTFRRWQALAKRLIARISLADLVYGKDAVLEELKAISDQWPLSAERPPLAEIAAAVQNSGAEELLKRLQNLGEQAVDLGRDMDFGMLYNEERHLFSVGYSLAAGRLDSAHYDLLASEARLASFLAIARGDAPRRHWFQLGRPVTSVAGNITLVSWGGTMFEYLMPRLLMRALPGSLLETGERAAVLRQIQYGRQRHVPWGISESAFNALDTALDYQYQSFGVPGLGLKRGLAHDLVIAPYATALAVTVQPRAALHNLARIAAEGGEGPYGFYEAMDYTPSRVPPQRRCGVVRSYMAHHQGMALVALANCLLGSPMQRRFHAEAQVRATDMLLEERVPRSAPILQPHGDEAAVPAETRDHVYPMSRRLTTADTPHPRTHLLSNSQYSVMVTNAGSGQSICRGLAVTRWREDRTADGWGQFLYLRDLRSGLVWSATHQPIGGVADEYEVVYSTDKAAFRRVIDNVETHLEITVSPENTAEVRRLMVTNHDSRYRELEVTSYAEIVLAPQAADLAHPAFGKLFVETEFDAAADALIARRRPRSADQKPVHGVHVVAADGHTVGGVQYETDRARFLGRGRTAANPAALDRGAVLSGTTGAVLDPIFSLRRWVRVAPGTSVSLAFTTALADTREEALALADKYHNFHGIARAFELAWAHSQVELRHYRLTTEEAHLFQRLAAHVIYAGAALRAPASVLQSNRQGQPGLWRYGISGDKPIVLLKVQEADQLGFVRQLLAAHTYWRINGLEVDLIILNEHPTGYFEELHQQLQNLVRASDAHGFIDKPGGVFVRKAALVPAEDQVLLQSMARVVLSADRGTLLSQIERGERLPELPPKLRVARRRLTDEREAVPPKVSLPGNLLFPNGLGGFTPDGKEYVILQAASIEAPGSDRGRTPTATARTPAPWINVIANPSFGFLVSESGGGYTWAGNSQSNRLTPWTNDPVADPPGEVIYLRDDVSGDLWTPTPLPLAAGPTLVRHGQGYTVFEQSGQGLAHELTLLVPPDASVKLFRLKIRNLEDRSRRLSAAFYAEWVLGTLRDQAPLQVLTEIDPESGALLARNPASMDFASRVAFADVNLRPRTLSADRTEFLGRNGSVAAPAALRREELSGRAGPALDPCAALLARFRLGPGEEKEIVFLLGQAADIDEARRLVRQYKEPGRTTHALTDAKRQWDDILGTVQVRTPNPALDLMLNRWLLYQTLACRIWGRSAFYQSGGAYGFRDQLQDVMALVHGDANEARAHILRAAARQFIEGDVQHWWHPPAGRGIRTRFSDDLLWLPLVVAHYVSTTGDRGILDENVPYLQGPLLKPEEEEEYGLPQPSDQSSTVFEHCVRAIDRSLRLGSHGLPLMGTGDWNDGMNKVGAGGKGESVWVAWFLLTILDRFIPLARARGEGERAERYRDEADRLRAAVEEHAWDGHWYRRAYFDDGTPLGSTVNDECRIDSLAQTWAVISGQADPRRAQEAMISVEKMLVRRADKLILLFTPPFDQGTLEPGYIKGYLPGIRENGGQYTHAATWVVQATAMLGQGTLAGELFDLLNPISHAATPEDVARYKVEPYVAVADNYGHPPHVGRGGWTWYTGSSGWLYRVGLENMLGFQRRGDLLAIHPCVPATWREFEITYRHGSATYRIVVENPDGVERGVKRLSLNGQAREGAEFPLAAEGTYEVRVRMGQAQR